MIVTLAFATLLTFGSMYANEESDKASQETITARERAKNAAIGSLKAIGTIISAGAVANSFYLLFFKPPCNDCCPRQTNNIPLFLLQGVRIYTTYRLCR